MQYKYMSLTYEYYEYNIITILPPKIKIILTSN